MVDIEHELRAAIEERVTGLTAPSDLAERARRAGKRRRRTHVLVVAGVAAGAVAAVAMVPLLAQSKTSRLTPGASTKHIVVTHTAVDKPSPTISAALCGSEAHALNIPPGSPIPPPARPRDPLPGLEVTYLPKGALRPGGGVGGSAPKEHTWMYGANFQFPSGMPAVGVQVVCGPVAHDLQALLRWRGGASASGMRSTVVHGKPALRHDSRPIPGEMSYDVIWIERPGIAIWIETGRDMGNQLNAIVNGIKVTG